MIWAGISVFAVLAILGLLAVVTQRAVYPEMSLMVSKLNRAQAEYQHEEALKAAERRFQKKPVMAMNRKEFDYYLTLAILTKDRIHALKGMPNGPGVRKKWRGEIVSQIKKQASDQQSEMI